MTLQPPAIIQRLGTILGGLLADVGVRVAWGGIAMPLNVMIARIIEGHRQRIERIVARIRAGTYALRRRPAATTRPASTRPAKPPALVKQGFGWLLPLIPPYWQANTHRNEVEALLQDPEMVALIAAAPVSLGRPLRSLCWMLRIKPPAHLLPPRRPSPPPATQPQTGTSLQESPPSPRRSPARRRPVLPSPSACGPPHPA